MKIENIAKNIKLILRKDRVGTIQEDKIGEAILAAEKDLHSELVAVYKTQKYLHEQLNPFVVKTVLTMTNGANTLGSDIPLILAAEVKQGTARYPARIMYDPEKFGAGNEVDAKNEGTSNSIPEHLLLKEITVNAEVTTLSEGFIEAVGGYNVVAGEPFMGVQIDPKRWGSKDFKEIVGDKESPDEISHLNIEEVTVLAASLSTGSVDIPAGMVKLLSGTSVISGKNYEGVVVKPEYFDSKKLKDLSINGGLKNQLTTVKSTIALTAGTGNLPDGFILDKAIFDAGGNEGIILDNAEFLDRKNSVILTPDEEEPIGQIMDDKIQVEPNTIQSIDMYHYQFPTQKTPAITVIGSKIHVYPIPTSNMKFRIIKDATERRPRFKVAEGKLTVNPVPTAFKFTFKEYPTEKAAQVRYVSDKVEVKPITVTELEVSYVNKLTPAVYATTNSAGNRGKEFTSVGSTDTMFGENATQALVAKALKYLGIPYKDAPATSFEQIHRG